LFLKQWHGPK